MIDISLYLLFFLLGLIIGSFLNVLIIRLPKGESVVFGRSKCPKCKKTLSAWELIPVLSYIFLSGRCKNCRKTISIQYPLVELSSGLLFVLFYYLFGLNYLLVFYLLFVAAAIVIFVYDTKYLEIPEIFSWILLVLALVIGIWQSSFPFSNFLLGGLIGGGILGILVGVSNEKLMGSGDIKIGLAFGFLLGYPRALLFLLLSFMIGAIVGVIMMLFSDKKLKSEVAFAPFMIIAGIIVLIWGDTIINSYLSLI